MTPPRYSAYAPLHTSLVSLLLPSARQSVRTVTGSALCCSLLLLVLLLVLLPLLWGPKCLGPHDATAEPPDSRRCRRPCPRPGRASLDGSCSRGRLGGEGRGGARDPRGGQRLRLPDSPKLQPGGPPRSLNRSNWTAQLLKPAQTSWPSEVAGAGSEGTLCERRPLLKQRSGSDS
ncbi:hypothetical protein NDU88_001674 [Pleurodeles waltl]|uniref:Uncharacterized protein n=1 Tax=Pleurodeles waltl TaxID=8319 RepID=A0AAV7WMU5_PLEWA|nr:hypothetical protein NDU88_001674 [Pleurodeles waltl]